MDKRRFLKVKIKSLAAEAGIIRMEERRSKGTLRDELHAHRIVIVRKESRLTLIAYAVVRGKKPADSLRNLSQEDWKRVTSMVRKYGDERSTRGAEELQSLQAAGSNPAERAA